MGSCLHTVSLAQETGLPRSYSIVLSRLLPLFEKVGEVFGNNVIVLEIIWLANLASTKMRSYTRVAVLRKQ